MREIRRLTKEDLNNYSQIAFHAYPSFKDFSQVGFRNFEEKMLAHMHSDQNTTFIGLFENGKLAAQMRMILFETNLFGKIVKTGGLASLAVDNLHKKKGMGHELLTYFENFCLENNAPIAMLLPFDPLFYHKEGYGYGSKMNLYQIQTNYLPKYLNKMDMRFLSAVDKQQMQETFNKMLPTSHGLMEKLSYEWQDVFDDLGNLIVGSYDENGELEGYLIYRLENDHEQNYTRIRLVVKEMIYADKETMMKLLGYIHKQDDQVQYVTLRTFEEDFHYYLTNPVNESLNFIDFGYLEANKQYVGNMYKLLNVKKAFEQLDYRNYNDVTLNVYFVINNISTYVSFVNGKASVHEILETNVKVEMALTDFSSIFIGATNFDQLYRLGLVKIDNEKYLSTLNQVFYYHQKPVCWSDF
ncbi:MAG: GNAT family N-acetyltransferase [Streptococcaceae bacterium]|jgi:predicted acetyltransferase|nr:GNAT family N-acetyltransferase [Streptococcaceae bacterium]